MAGTKLELEYAADAETDPYVRTLQRAGAKVLDQLYDPDEDAQYLVLETRNPKSLDLALQTAVARGEIPGYQLIAPRRR